MDKKKGALEAPKNKTLTTQKFILLTKIIFFYYD